MIVPKADPVSLQFCLAVCKSSAHITTVTHTDNHIHTFQMLRMWLCSNWLLEVPAVTLETTSIHSFIPLVPRSDYEVLLKHVTYLSMAGSAWLEWYWIELIWIKSNQIQVNWIFVCLYTVCAHACVCTHKSFYSIHPWRCMLKDQFETAARKTQPDA